MIFIYIFGRWNERRSRHDWKWEWEWKWESEWKWEWEWGYWIWEDWKGRKEREIKVLSEFRDLEQ